MQGLPEQSSLSDGLASCIGGLSARGKEAVVVHQMIETTEFVFGPISNTPVKKHPNDKISALRV